MDNSKEDKKQSAEKKPASQGGNLVWYVLGMFIILLLLGTVFSGNNALEISMSELEQLLVASNPENDDDPRYITVDRPKAKEPVQLKLSDPKDLVVGSTGVTGTVKKFYRDLPGKSTEGSQGDPGQGNQGTTNDQASTAFKETEGRVKFRVDRLPSEQRFVNLLAENNITDWDYEQTPSQWLGLLPVLMLTGMFVLLMIIMLRRMGGAGSPMAFGRSRGKLIAQDDIDASFDDVAGIEEAVDELREVVDFLKNPERYHRLGGRIPRGVLLVGPPGTGKTLLARAVAGEAEVPFYSLSGSDFVEMFVGVGAARVRDMFGQAEQRAPCIIFIDELDALGKTRGSGQMGGHDEREQTLNALLVEMDGFGTNSGVIVMGATNRPETLDPALLRPGRFDRHVLVDRPDVGGREDILNVHLQNIKVDEKVDVKRIAAITSGFVGADLANLVNEAALLAARNGKKAVGMVELNEAVERSAVGLEKKSRIMQDDEKLRLAYHEAGHALVAYVLPNTDPVHKVSILPRGMGALGYMMQRPEFDRFMMTRDQLKSQIQVCLGGTVAEEIIYEGDIGNGATSDLERATSIARSMVMDFGMSPLGRVKFRENNRNQFLGGEFGGAQGHSEQTAREIDEQVNKYMEEGLEKVRHILEKRRPTLEAITKILLKEETIDGDEFRRIMEENSVGPMVVPGTDAEPKRPAREESQNGSDAEASGS
ncbi:ATP-dependent zinc metalloprotease FtsH [Adhaeretor mobilis]|uniref:ATP-dependent zinc metalloprotease FtsH n=1 Tax=Adhaeretor mobilis TaxID=1930276 RepID=A0A517MQU1_9BACT|nr:ATP-dependent zinc metalloprotease FtsH [Adhaeretor mobilis]QDS97249.1 ATP-dependent zinc metalloprotease FtsH [Adhaeretor mobilis]